MSSFSPSMTTTFTVVEPTSTPIHNSSYFFCGFAFSVSPGIYTPLCVIGYRWPADHVVAPASRQLGKAECPYHGGQDARYFSVLFHVIRHLSAHLLRHMDSEVGRGPNHAFVLGHMVDGLRHLRMLGHVGLQLIRGLADLRQHILELQLGLGLGFAQGHLHPAVGVDFAFA